MHQSHFHHGVLKVNVHLHMRTSRAELSVIAVVPTPPPWCSSLAADVDMHTLYGTAPTLPHLHFVLITILPCRPQTYPPKDHCLIMTMSAMNAIKWK